MASWSISELTLDDVESFVDCQLLAFVGNDLHDIVYPSREVAVEKHSKILNDGLKSADGSRTLYFKATDDASGAILGGVKCIYYPEIDATEKSPHAAGKKPTPLVDEASEDERYRQDVVNTFLDKRIRQMKGPHAVLDLLFTGEKAQRKGIGRELVARVCRESDLQNLITFVEASPKGKRSYELNGFESKEAVTISLPDKWPGRPEHLYYWMERPPKVNLEG